MVIAGTNSGCGKTTVSIGIMAALVKKGIKVQPFKIGPDYIDPMFHTFITGKKSRNLDGWLLDEKIIKYLFCKSAENNVDIAVVEGMMGLYDGHEAFDHIGSTSHVAKVIKAPVVLVVNTDGMSMSIAALLKGFKDFDINLPIKGVVINNIYNQYHYLLIKGIIEEYSGIKVLGYLPRMEECNLPDRHLGLVTSNEVADLEKKINILSETILNTIDLDYLIKLAGEAESIDIPGIGLEKTATPGECKIAVAKDGSFNFYYEDNLELLESLGAELVFFSPLNDIRLPDNINGVYIGGGYPEVWAKQLEENFSMRESIKFHIKNGIPAYAECGGLMYLSKSIKDHDGQVYNMVGVIPGKSKMTNNLQTFGYVEIEIKEDNILAAKKQKIRAHDFHFSITDIEKEICRCYEVTKKSGYGETASWMSGYKIYNLLAGYPHMHFWSNIDFAEGFVANCAKYKADLLV